MIILPFQGGVLPSIIKLLNPFEMSVIGAITFAILVLIMAYYLMKDDKK